MTDPSQQEPDDDIERIKAWANLWLHVLDRLGDIAIKYAGSRPLLTLVLLTLLVWGVVTGQAWASAGLVVSPLLRLIGK
jgi:hypothetical protein